MVSIGGAYLYLVFNPTSIGFPALFTSHPSLSISLNAAFNPYHCASNCFLPSALVRGSWNDALSVHKVSLRFDGWPEKRSRTEAVRSCCEGERETPALGFRAEEGVRILYSVKREEGSEGAILEGVVVKVRCWVGG